MEVDPKIPVKKRGFVMALYPQSMGLIGRMCAGLVADSVLENFQKSEIVAAEAATAIAIAIAK